MNNYGNSGVEMARVGGNGLDNTNGGQMNAEKRHSRYSALPVPTLHGDQPDGAHIADSPLAGRHSDPPAFDDFMDADGRQLSYAELSAGW